MAVKEYELNFDQEQVEAFILLVKNLELLPRKKDNKYYQELLEGYRQTLESVIDKSTERQEKIRENPNLNALGKPEKISIFKKLKEIIKKIGRCVSFN